MCHVTTLATTATNAMQPLGHAASIFDGPYPLSALGARVFPTKYCECMRTPLAQLQAEHEVILWGAVGAPSAYHSLEP